MFVDRFAVSETFVKDVLANDQLFLDLTAKLKSRPFNKYCYRNVRQLQKWDAMGLLMEEEKQYLELVVVWKQRLDALRIWHFKACFNH
tara:strand:- start:1713 stop:1976 length:264 start_codon:yes stop_codon:yes gene_type:complete